MNFLGLNFLRCFTGNISPGGRPVMAHLDKVADAVADRPRELPYQKLGLSDEEFKSICSLLGRRPTSSELAIYSVMWSEHCSYKSSKIHLRQFGESLTPEMRQHLMVGIGQNAGVVDIGDGWAVTFKVESHNHPSFVEPFQGAATGVGGIVRDIISMGARPVALMDQLRFGAPEHPDTARVLGGVVRGISFYGNCLGLPNVGGETVFDPVYQGNPLVNVLCMGVMRHEDVHLADASGDGNLVVLFGAATGGDGIGGASVLASDSFSSDSFGSAAGKTRARPAVQVGDPFAEKLLIECCQELFQKKLVVALQDLGAAGISCATAELAANGGVGMDLELTRAPLRDPQLRPEEILMSESQERMMAIVSPEAWEAFKAVVGRWEIQASVLGKVVEAGENTGRPRLTIRWEGEPIVSVDPKTVAEDAPLLRRSCQRPANQDRLQADTAATLPRTAEPEQLLAEIMQLVGSAELADKSWITDQYDCYVQGNTAQAFPDDAGVVRVDAETGRGVALATDGNGRHCYLDPRRGVQLALAEAYRNVACSGARPLAVTDCLNFGSPQQPEVMWQFAETTAGLAAGCVQLGIPVTGGNVSFYNQTDQTQVYPTPVVGVLGLLEDVGRRVSSGWQEPGLELMLLGRTVGSGSDSTSDLGLDGSAWAAIVHGHVGGLPPQPDLPGERRLADLLGAAAATGLLLAAHDISAGGLAMTLVEGALRFEQKPMSVSVDLSELCARDGVDLSVALFSENPGRVLVALRPERRLELEELAAAADYALLPLGSTAAEADQDPVLRIAGLPELPLPRLREQHRSTLPRLASNL